MRLALLTLPLALCGTSPAFARACDEYLRHEVRASGAYQPAAEAYSQHYVFAFELECKGVKELVTVQRPTGNLPVCTAGQPVEVVGRLIWNKALVSGHYEINDPASVTCQ